MLSGTTGGLGSFGELTLGYHGIGRDTVTSQLPDQKWTLTIDRPMRVGFTLTSSQTDVDLRLFHGKTPRVTSTTPGPASESFARTLRPGHYTLIVSKHAQADGYYELHVDTSVEASPTRVEAEALGGTAVRVNWLDHSDNESGFAVQQWRKHRWHTVVRTDADATAAVVHNQPINAAMTFRVRSEAVGGTGISPDAAVVTTGAEDTSGWYKVTGLGGMTQAEAKWTPDSDTLAIQPPNSDGWTYAASWEDAVFASVAGLAKLKKTDGSIATHNFSNAGDFKVGFAGIMHDNKDSTSDPGEIKDNELPDTDDLKVIALEDSYNNGQIDLDYDDFYWTIAVEKLEFDKTYLKRDVESSDLYAEDGGGSIGAGDKYDFKVDLKNPISNPNDVTWELWETSGFNSKIAIGSGLEFDYPLLSGASGYFMRFYLDINGNGDWDSGEYVVDKSFSSQNYKVQYVTIAQPNTITPISNSMIDQYLQKATDLISIRDTQDDRRAATRFVRSGNVITWTVAPNKPDFITSQADFDNLIANVNARVRIVRGYSWPSGTAIGLTYNGVANSVTVQVGTDGRTWAHEMGHELGLHHRTGTDLLMDPTIGPDTVINDAERAAFE